jgi:antibiotic biosynthesis monooxygenase (ABM) superfamily enzyme
VPGQEAAYEALVREMFGQMRASKGFLAADLLPPEAPGDYQVVINFASEADLAAWDACPARAAIHARMREVAEAEPEYRSLSGLEAWFAPAVVPASMHPPRARMAVVTWLGIFPTVSFFLYFVRPTCRGCPSCPARLLTGLIVMTMTWVVMPRLTRWMRGFLNPHAKVGGAPPPGQRGDP